jgi:flagellar hook-length control protein FliK
MSESSSSNAGKDSSFGTVSNTMPQMSLMPQPIPSEIRINQWIDPAPAAAAAATAAEILTGSSLGTEREILREQNAVFKINQPDVAPDLQTYSATGADNSFSLSSAEGAVPMETYVAEQVTYWINQDIQNAELTLEGIGLDPVQVNISMQGNEAFVTFTTDEQQARDALESARQQLEDMLQSQGIQLSGLSVGSHGSGNAGTQDRNPRQGNKQTVVTSVQPEIQENKPKSGLTSGSTLDLFV